MAVTARFGADFGAFFSAVTEAEVKLRGFDAEARTVEKSLNKMVDSLTGRRVAQEAQLMTEAVRRIGSPARLTANELQRVGAVAEEAIEKFRRMGQQAPPHMIKLAEAARRARTNTDGLRQTFQQFDGALASVGVNLGPIPRGVDDIASAAGKTAGELGKLATAGLAASAAFAGWNIGRWIADLAGTDKIIGDFTAKLLGWGDVAAEEAAAGADVLARASANAKRPITDMAEAMAINEKAAKDMADAHRKAGEASKRFADIEAANVQKIMGLYHQANEAGRKRADDERKDWTEILQQRQEGEADLARQRQETADRDAQFTREYVQALTDVQEADIRRLQTEVQIRKETEATTMALRAQRLEAESIARSLGSVVEYDLSTKEGMAEFKRQNPGAEVNAPTEYFQTHTLADAMRQGLVKFNSVGQSGGYALSGLGAPRSSFGPMAWGGEPGRGKYGQEPTVVINVNGVIDQSSKDAIAQASADGIVRRVSNGAALGGW